MRGIPLMVNIQALELYHQECYAHRMSENAGVKKRGGNPISNDARTMILKHTGWG